MKTHLDTFSEQDLLSRKDPIADSIIQNLGKHFDQIDSAPKDAIIRKALEASQKTRDFGSEAGFRSSILANQEAFKTFASMTMKASVFRDFSTGQKSAEYLVAFFTAMYNEGRPYVVCSNADEFARAVGTSEPGLLYRRSLLRVVHLSKEKGVLLVPTDSLLNGLSQYERPLTKEAEQILLKEAAAKEVLAQKRIQERPLIGRLQNALNTLRS